jgi:hypothetical protein
MRPSNDELRKLYIDQRLSPVVIGQMFGRSGRSVREWMTEAGIPRLGPSHLRRGISAEWNKGPRSAEHSAALSRSRRGKPAHNKGKGSREFKCIVCDKLTFAKPYRLKITCSASCLSRLRGTSHWNFKGGDAAFRQRQRNWADVREWRIAVLSRCSFLCVKCKSGGRLTAHHLNSFSKFPDQRFDPENGVALCLSLIHI